MRKAIFILHRFKEENKAKRSVIVSIQTRSAISLLKNTFHTWVKKYQYRVTRRPLLLKSLTFWGENTVRKAFKSLKIYKHDIDKTRLHLRTFWCIRAAIIIIDNTSIYDKIIYPSQAFNLPIKNYDEKQLNITIRTYDYSYKQRLFKTWKTYYISMRNQKAKLAFSYVQKAFSGWKTWKEQEKVYKQKIQNFKEKHNQREMSNVWQAMSFYLKQSITLKTSEQQ